MNFIVIERNEISEKIIELAKNSRFLDKIFTASNFPLENIPNIEYENIQDLISKCKALQIDAAITFDKTLIEQGIMEYFRRNGINIFCPNKKWLNLETSRLAAKKLLEYYSINIPQTLPVPLCFPVILKTETPEYTVKLNSMNEVIEAKKILKNKKIFFEEFLDGKIFEFIFAWDGKNLKMFKDESRLTEVQIDRLDLLNTKLNFMFSDENVDFYGIFGLKLIWVKNDWYILDFKMTRIKKSAFDLIKTDFLYVLNLIIYQKFNEI